MLCSQPPAIMTASAPAAITASVRHRATTQSRRLLPPAGPAVPAGGRRQETPAHRGWRDHSAGSSPANPQRRLIAGKCRPAPATKSGRRRKVPYIWRQFGDLVARRARLARTSCNQVDGNVPRCCQFAPLSPGAAGPVARSRRRHVAVRHHGGRASAGRPSPARLASRRRHRRRLRGRHCRRLTQPTYAGAFGAELCRWLAGSPSPAKPDDPKRDLAPEPPDTTLCPEPELGGKILGTCRSRNYECLGPVVGVKAWTPPVDNRAKGPGSTAATAAAAVLTRPAARN